MKCHTRYPGMNVAISQRGHSLESARDLDGLVSGSETSDYISRKYLPVTKFHALMQSLGRRNTYTRKYNAQ